MTFLSADKCYSLFLSRDTPNECNGLQIQKHNRQAKTKLSNCNCINKNTDHYNEMQILDGIVYQFSLSQSSKHRSVGF